jgi:transposase
MVMESEHGQATSHVMASAEQVAALRELSRSPRRDEADRARAILLSLEGWTSEAIGTAFGVTADSVRHWRTWYASQGVEGLRAAVIPGPSGERGLQALAIAAAVLAEPVANRSNWTLPRLQAEIARRGGPPLSRSRLSVLLRGKGGSAGDGPGTP